MVNDLIYCSPEEEGLKSEEILRFLDSIDFNRRNIHSLMIVRHGKILFETYAKNFNKDYLHRIYSCSKTYVALAVGKLAMEGLVSVNDRILKYFPEYDEDCVSENLKNLTIRQMLVMATPYIDTLYCTHPGYVNFSCDKNNWSEKFLKPQTSESYSKPGYFEKPAGCSFLYDTGSPQVLGYLVYKLTGKQPTEYLRSVFDEIGVGEVKCVKAPEGVEAMGTGVLTTLRDFAKVGEFIMHKGNVNGKQVLPLGYMTDFISPLIANDFGANFVPSDNCGYGYQTWIHPNGFSLQGMRGQFVFAFPDKDFMLVQNANIEGDGGIGEHATNLYKSLEDKPLKTGRAYVKLKKREKSFEVKPLYGNAYDKIEETISKKRYFLDGNDMGIRWIQLDFRKQCGTFKYYKDGEIKSIKFGRLKGVEIEFPEKHEIGFEIGESYNKGYRTFASASWGANKHLHLLCDIEDIHIGYLCFNFDFKGDAVVLKVNRVCEFMLETYHGYAIGKLQK